MGLVSVASADQTDALLQWGEQVTEAPVCRVRSEPKLARLTNGYRDPKQLGADRWAAALGAVQWAEARLPSAMSVLVVSAGTATVIDGLTRSSRMPGDNVGPNWQFDGGVILPGIGLMRSMLCAGTSALAPLFDAPAKGLSAAGWPQDSSAALAHGIGLAQTAPILALPPADAMVVHGGHAQAWIEHHAECVERVGGHGPQGPPCKGPALSRSCVRWHLSRDAADGLARVSNSRQGLGGGPFVLKGDGQDASPPALHLGPSHDVFEPPVATLDQHIGPHGHNERERRVV